MGENTTAHEPPPIRQLSAPDLKALLKSGTALELVDVRTEEERAIATIDGSRLLDQAYLDALLLRDRDTPIVFQCHHGVRHARVGFGGMQFVGSEAGHLVFVRIRELLPEDQLSPARSHTMRLDSQRVATVSVDGRSVWPGGSRSVTRHAPRTTSRTAIHVRGQPDRR